MAALITGAALWASSAHSHLMVAQHGTLNFLDDDVYMVLSLPAAAFEAADEDSDGQLSLTEFAQHRLDIINEVAAQVTLSDSQGTLPLYGLMVSPVTPHDSPKEPADQIIVMGRFSLTERAADMLVKENMDKHLNEVVDTAVKRMIDSQHEVPENKELQFHVGLFGKHAIERSIEITASRKSENKKHVFTLSPEIKRTHINFH